MKDVDVTDVVVAMSDGVKLAARIYRPQADGAARAGQWPTLFAASPYRFDNDEVPEAGMFLWHETGPIAWYVAQGYAYVHVDVRGSGRSEGDYGFFDRRERRDLYEMIEWIAAQPWSNGKVGGIGHSYYATSQWCMAAERPPHLACIAPYDGHVDIFRGWAYPGGVPGKFLNEWWNNNVRPTNQFPANGGPSRLLPFDLSFEVAQHPHLDAFWAERSFVDALSDVTIPVYSIGVWCKLDLHLAGNILGFEKVAGPKKLLISGAPHMSAAQAEFESIDFHRRVLLPFYDRYLKGADTDYEARPAVEYAVRNSKDVVQQPQWPPAAANRPFYLGDAKTESVTSLNDGALSEAPPKSAESATAYSYPDHLWMLGHVTFGPNGPDGVARVLTFTSAPLPDNMTMSGHAELILHLSSTGPDTDVIVKLSAQAPQAPEDRARGVQPPSMVVTKGWLRASCRAVDPAASREGAPVLTFGGPQPLQPGKPYELRVPLMPMAYRFAKGSRIRVEIACADSPITDAVFSHHFTPDRAGTDTIHHSAVFPSRLLLPVADA